MLLIELINRCQTNTVILYVIKLAKHMVMLVHLGTGVGVTVPGVCLLSYVLFAGRTSHTVELYVEVALTELQNYGAPVAGRLGALMSYDQERWGC